ncbi:MAG: hypothetical protein AAF327_14225, partial [Cyanobacteria bacterium P01_A01_bin.37]
RHRIWVFGFNDVQVLTSSINVVDGHLQILYRSSLETLAAMPVGLWGHSLLRTMHWMNASH